MRIVTKKQPLIASLPISASFVESQPSPPNSGTLMPSFQAFESRVADYRCSNPELNIKHPGSPARIAARKILIATPIRLRRDNLAALLHKRLGKNYPATLRHTPESDRTSAAFVAFQPFVSRANFVHAPETDR